jgi:hypothetical protein
VYKLKLRRAAIALVASTFLLVVAGCASAPVPRPDPPTATSTSTASPRPTASSRPTTPADDSGPSGSANGEAVLVSSGVYSYTVADGDALVAIAQRFGVCLDDITSPESEKTIYLHPSDLRIGQHLTVQRTDGNGIRTCLAL